MQKFHKKKPRSSTNTSPALLKARLRERESSCSSSHPRHTRGLLQYRVMVAAAARGDEHPLVARYREITEDEAMPCFFATLCGCALSSRKHYACASALAGCVTRLWSRRPSLLGVLLAAFRAPSLIVTGSASMLDGVGLIIALFSIASKEALFHLTHAVGMRCQSSTLVANAHHHRSDAMSSIAAACGIGGAIAGVQLLDPLAALIVGGMVLKLAVETAGGH